MIFKLRSIETFIVLMLSFNGISQFEDTITHCNVTDLEVAGLKGRVKSVTFENKLIWRYRVSETESRDSIQLTSGTHCYGPDGYLKACESEAELYNSQYIINFNDDSTLVERISIYDIDTVVTRHWYQNCRIQRTEEYGRTVTYTYDSLGNLKEKLTVGYFGDTVSLKLFEVENSKVTKIQEYDLISDQIIQTNTFEYDEEGRLKRWQIFNEDGIALVHNTYHYSRKGYLKIRNAVREGESYAQTVYKSDKHGNWIKARTYDKLTKNRLKQRRVIEYY